jgi:hypothetical protein
MLSLKFSLPSYNKSPFVKEGRGLHMRLDDEVECIIYLIMVASDAKYSVDETKVFEFQF